MLNEEGDEEVREEHKQEAEEERLERREHNNIMDTEQDDGGSVPATVSTTPAAQVVERELRVHVYRNEGEAMEEEDQIEEDSSDESVIPHPKRPRYNTNSLIH